MNVTSKSGRLSVAGVPISNSLSFGRELFKHPIEALDRIRNKLERRRTVDGARGPRSGNSELRAQLHAHLGISWPCRCASEFDEIWTSLQAELGTIGSGHDANKALSSSLFSVARHTKPTRVVEIGVARGVTSRLILEGLQLNNHGHLWSIDLPPLSKPWADQIGIAVPQSSLRERWRYIRGSSRRRLLPLLRSLQSIDLSLHDGLHTGSTVRFELQTVRPFLSTNAFVVVDDVHENDAIDGFAAHNPFKTLLGEQSPGSGLFAVLLPVG